MKKLCFGTLLILMYQARSQSVTYKKICDAVFTAYGCDGMAVRDKSLPGHLKTGHDNVPPDVVSAARNMPFEEAIDAFEREVSPLIKETNVKPFIHAIKAVLREDNMPEDTLIGNTAGFEKKAILKGNKFILSPLLAALFHYAIVNVSNSECQDELKDFENNYLSSVDTREQLYIDPLSKAGEADDAESIPLQRTLKDGNFSKVFKKVSSLTVAGITHPSTAEIYCADLNNGRLRFSKVKEYLADNIGTYVFSRARVERYDKRPVGALGTQALIQFQKVYGAAADTVLGELMLYVFLEEGLDAPKIMSKIEFSQHGGIASRSDGIHLIATTEFGRPFNQLVFGASNIEGKLEQAVDRAFERILKIEENTDIEFSIVENTAYNLVFDDATNEYIRDIMVPRRPYVHKPDMAFGLFLGYTLVLDQPETDSARYRVAAEAQLKKDVESIKAYIAQKIKDNHMEGYSFYCYILPFNDAPTEKTSLIDEMLEGR